MTFLIVVFTSFVVCSLLRKFYYHLTFPYIPLFLVLLAFVHDTFMEVKNNIEVSERNTYKDMFVAIAFAIVPLVNIVVVFLYWGQLIIRHIKRKSICHAIIMMISSFLLHLMTLCFS